MNAFEKIRLKLILKLGFKYYDEDKYLIKKCLRSVKNKNPKVLDVGCGTGHHAFMFEKYGRYKHWKDNASCHSYPW